MIVCIGCILMACTVPAIAFRVHAIVRQFAKED